MVDKLIDQHNWCNNTVGDIDHRCASVDGKSNLLRHQNNSQRYFRVATNDLIAIKILAAESAENNSNALTHSLSTAEDERITDDDSGVDEGAIDGLVIIDECSQNRKMTTIASAFNAVDEFATVSLLSRSIKSSINCHTTVTVKSNKVTEPSATESLAFHLGGDAGLIIGS